LEPLAGEEIIEEAEKRIAVSEAQIGRIFEAIECLRKWIKDEIAGGRNETEVLDDDDYDEAIGKCVSEDFLKALDGSESLTSN
jgi:hypothetical protein